jgi:hypothetical protein
MVWRVGRMETLFAIGMMVGLMQSRAEPPKAPLVQRQIAQHQAEADKSRPRKKAEWLLSY